jgi:integrase
MPREKRKTKEWPAIRYHKPRKSWMVDAGTRVSEKRIRKYFKGRAEAEVYSDQLRVKLKNQGISGFSLSKGEHVDAEIALKLLQPLGSSLTEAAKFFAEYHNLKGADMTFADLVGDYRLKLETNRGKGEGVADRTFKDYQSRHGRLADEFGSLNLIEFSHINHWEPFSRKLGKSSRRYENHLRILFNHAVERGYLKSSPMIGKLSDAPILNKPVILQEAQWRQLLLTAVETDAELDLLCYVVLILYMGLRPESEVEHLTWTNINFKTKKLFIGDEQTGKSYLGRTLEIPTAAINLLSRCERKKGKVVQSKYEHRKNWLSLREQAGLIVRDDKGERIKNDWIPDIARHTAGTMVYAKTQSKEAVKTFLGHTNDVTMRNYVNHGDSMDCEADRFYAFEVQPASSDASSIVKSA